MSDTSLVFNLVARDNTEQGLSSAQERFDAAAAGIGAGVGVALGAGVAAHLDMEAANSKLAAQLGLGSQEAAEVAAVSADVYSNAWGDSVDTVNLAIKGVYQNIGDVSEAEGGLEGVTTKALALAETFDQDLTMTTAAVGQLMRTGLVDSADEAFDVITVGLGSAADKSGDFLETLNEYSTQWRRLGVDAQTATGLLAQGLKAGARDADQVADALGQFGERALAGGAPVEEAFKNIGLNAGTMAKLLGQGGDSAEKALQMTMDALRGTSNEQTRLNSAAALFGDPANVMGDALFALDPATAAAAAGMDKAAGATDRLVEKAGGSTKSALESFKREALGKLADVAGGFIGFAMENRAVFEPLTYTLLGLAATVLIVKGAMMTWSAVSAVVAGANAIISASAWGVIGNWLRMMGIGLMAYGRIALGAVTSALTTAAAWTGSALVSIGTWIAGVVRAAVVSSAQFLLMAGRAIVWAATMAAQWLIAMGPVGWVIAIIIGLVALVIANWDAIKRYTQIAWDWVMDQVRGAVTAVLAAVGWLAALPGRVGGWFGSMKDAAVRKASQLVEWMKGLPRRIGSAVGSLSNLLVSKGRDIVTGLWNGIKGMGSWIYDKLIGWAKDMIPGPIAKALGIGSPSKVMAEVVGRWLPPGIVQGAVAEAPAMNRALGELVDPDAVRPSGRLPRRPLMASPPGGREMTVRIVVDGPEPVKKLIRYIVATDGGGDVAAAFNS
ncbi:phage tail tape measure protein [Streptomyces nigra]|uniref:phage tail tape measure protein n=1 Tax=Streptomyces nigra TaxID=1827580 RepID=UPI003454CE76